MPDVMYRQIWSLFSVDSPERLDTQEVFSALDALTP